MFARFPLHTEASGHSKAWQDWLIRAIDWWPVVLIGLLLLLAGSPESNAQSLLGAL
jgi:hypothetical protein